MRCANAWECDFDHVCVLGLMSLDSPSRCAHAARQPDRRHQQETPPRPQEILHRTSWRTLRQPEKTRRHIRTLMRLTSTGHHWSRPFELVTIVRLNQHCSFELVTIVRLQSDGIYSLLLLLLFIYFVTAAHLLCYSLTFDVLWLFVVSRT